jgi:hypothetical protein
VQRTLETMSLRRRSQAGTDAAAAVDQLDDLVGMTTRIEALLERAAANPHARGVRGEVVQAQRELRVLKNRLCAASTTTSP